ncbi:glycosyltransferase family 2 protein [Paenibacillus glycanilyticus]|nr:glycosyltransferase family 2 protein [Paenibacillus glycanilyticus]
MVTIGIPFYNAGSTLMDAIKSVFAQTYNDWELILLDDGSSDDSLTIARSIEDPRVKILSDGDNKGLPYRLNQMAKLARGKYLARMDADDVMHPERIERQVDYMEQNQEVDVVGTAVYIIDENNDVQGWSALRPIDTDHRNVLTKSLMSHPSVLGHSEWFRNNPYDEIYVRSEDHELWVRTVGHSTFSRIEIPLLYYRRNSTMNLRNYLLTYKTDRKIYRNYGPSIIGKWKVRTLIAKSHLKGLIYRLLHLSGTDHLKWKKKLEAMPDKDRMAALSTLATVHRVELPINKETRA